MHNVVKWPNINFEVCLAFFNIMCERVKQIFFVGLHVNTSAGCFVYERFSPSASTFLVFFKSTHFTAK